MESTTAQVEEISFSSLVELREFLSKHSQLEILRHFLGQPLEGAPDLLNRAIFVGLDLEWWEHEEPKPKPTTEIGLAVLRGQDLLAHNPDDKLLNLLNHIDVHHVRIIENCHFRNTKLAPKAEHNFLFGETRFLSKDDAKALLVSFLTGIETCGESAPIILLGHGGKDLKSDKHALWNDFKLRVDSISNLVYTMTTSPLAHQGRIRDEDHGPLEELLNGFAVIRGKFLPADKKGRRKRDKRFDHNAGNDIAYTALVALLIGLYPRLFPANAGGYPDVTMAQSEQDAKATTEYVEVQGTPMPDLLEAFIDLSNAKPAPTWGLQAYCFKCESTEHNYSSACTAVIPPCSFCSAVKGKVNSAIRSEAKNHTDGRCSVRYNPDKVKYAPLPTFIKNSKLNKKEQERFKAAVATGQKEVVGELMISLFENSPPFQMELGIDELSDEGLEKAKMEDLGQPVRTGIPRADPARAIFHASTR